MWTDRLGRVHDLTSAETLSFKQLAARLGVSGSSTKRLLAAGAELGPVLEVGGRRRWFAVCVDDYLAGQIRYTAAAEVVEKRRGKARDLAGVRGDAPARPGCDLASGSVGGR